MACTEHKILAEIVLPLSALIFFDVYAIGNDQEQLNPSGIVVYVSEVLFATHTSLINWLNTGTGQRGFVTGDQKYYDPYRRVIVNFANTLTLMTTADAVKPKQLYGIRARLTPLMKERLQIMDELTVAIHNNHRLNSFVGRDMALKSNETPEFCKHALD